MQYVKYMLNMLNPKVIEKRIMMELPFMASEAIIVEMVKHGANRQVSVAACWKEAMHALNLLTPAGFSSLSSPDTRFAQGKIPSLVYMCNIVCF